MNQDALPSHSPKHDPDDAVSLREQLRRQTEESAELQATIRSLQVEIKGIRGSLSWKLTRPLRGLAKRIPGVAAGAQRILDRIQDILAISLPKQVTQTLFDNRWHVRADIVEQISAYRAPPAGRRVVFYTAIFGGHDNLLLPERVDPEVDYVCFTDRPRNDYGVWKMRTAPYYHPDPTRIARWVKMHPHDLFPTHDVAVWLDANIVLKGDLRRYVDLVERQDAALGLISHPHRVCFYDEAEACKRLKKDSPKLIDQQVELYRTGGLPLKQPLFETGFMIVPLGKRETADALHLWWQQIERFSRRDQLGLAWVTHQLPDLKIVPLLRQGDSVRDHQDFSYFRHTFARALLVPETLTQHGTVKDPLVGTPFSEVREQRLSPLIGEPIDIVVCVHNALEDVRRCLQSVRDNLATGHRIIVVNDRSDAETTAYLRGFTTDRQVTLIENEENLGYTRSANRGLAAGTADFRILLNSDTIVSRDWALKMLDVARSSERIGIVSPLSNAAGAQSIPHIKGGGNNTVINALPGGLSPADFDRACEGWSFADLQPRVPLVHGFCFGIKRVVIDAVGLFDEENFKRFYGEENDYCFRALDAGFEFGLATNTFVFHRKSRSIDEEKRVVHMAEAWKRLRELYGTQRISLAYRQVEEHPLLRRMRSNAARFLKARQASRLAGISEG